MEEEEEEQEQEKEEKEKEKEEKEKEEKEKEKEKGEKEEKEEKEEKVVAGATVGLSGRVAVGCIPPQAAICRPVGRRGPFPPAFRPSDTAGVGVKDGPRGPAALRWRFAPSLTPAPYPCPSDSTPAGTDPGGLEVLP